MKSQEQSAKKAKKTAPKSLEDRIKKLEQNHRVGEGAFIDLKDVVLKTGQAIGQLQEAVKRVPSLEVKVGQTKAIIDSLCKQVAEMRSRLDQVWREHNFDDGEDEKPDEKFVVFVEREDDDDYPHRHLYFRGSPDKQRNGIWKWWTEKLEEAGIYRSVGPAVGVSSRQKPPPGYFWPGDSPAPYSSAPTYKDDDEDDGEDVAVYLIRAESVKGVNPCKCRKVPLFYAGSVEGTEDTYENWVEERRFAFKFKERLHAKQVIQQIGYPSTTGHSHGYRLEVEAVDSKLFQPVNEE